MELRSGKWVDVSCKIVDLKNMYLMHITSTLVLEFFMISAQTSVQSMGVTLIAIYFVVMLAMQDTIWIVKNHTILFNALY